MPRAPRSPHSHGPSEIWRRPRSTRAIQSALDRLAVNLRTTREATGMTLETAADRIGVHAKHLQRLETGGANPTVATLAAIAAAYGLTMVDLFAEPAARAPAVAPFHVLSAAEARPFENCIPLYPLEVAAGVFGRTAPAEATPEPAAWVVPQGRRRPGPGLFVARVVGESMSRRVPDGAYCLFASPVMGARQGRVLLVQHRDIQDPDSGGHHTVKIWRSRDPAGEAAAPHDIVLAPDSLAEGYDPIVIRGAREGEITIVAELVEVLPGTGVGTGDRR